MGFQAAAAFGGATAGAILGGWDGGFTGALKGAGIGFIVGATMGAGVDTFGMNFAFAAITLSAVYAGVSGGLEGLADFAGGMIGGAYGTVVGNAAVSTFTATPIANTPVERSYGGDSIADGDPRAALSVDLADDIGTNFGKSALEPWERRIDIYETVEAYYQFGSTDMKSALDMFKKAGGMFEYDPSYSGTAYYYEVQQIIAFGRGNWENPWPGYLPGKSGLERSLPHEIYHFLHHDPYSVEEPLAHIYADHQRKILIKNRRY